MNIKYTKGVLTPAVRTTKSYAGLARKLGLAPVGGTISNLNRACKRYQIDTSHFTGQGHRKGKQANNKRPANEILVLTENKLAHRQKASLLKRALLEKGREYKCEICSHIQWQGKELTLLIDHINGNFRDNREDNLRFLCPNCHSQTPTFANKRPR